jgi:transcription initiation factor TFIID TATA-box-binding protein
MDDDDEFLLGEDLKDTDGRSVAQYARFAEETDIDNDSCISVLDGIESMKPKVVNIVASADFGVQFDLFKISTQVRNSEYNPRRFQAVILRIQEPRATALVFKTGKINVIGCRREEDAERAARKFGRIVLLAGYQMKMKSFVISNLVATISCNFPVDLAMITNHPGHRQLAKYQPEVFAGVIYKIPDPRVTLLIFASGKIVMTGAKNREMLQSAAEWVYPILKIFQKHEFQMPDPIKEEVRRDVEGETKKKMKEKDDPFGFKASRAKARRPVQ